MIVVSAVTAPDAPHITHCVGTRNRTGLVAMKYLKHSAFQTARRLLFDASEEMRVRRTNKRAKPIVEVDLRAHQSDDTRNLDMPQDDAADRRLIIDRADRMLKQSHTLRQMSEALLKESKDLKQESSDVRRSASHKASGKKR